MVQFSKPSTCSLGSFPCRFSSGLSLELCTQLYGMPLLSPSLLVSHTLWLSRSPLSWSSPPGMSHASSGHCHMLPAGSCSCSCCCGCCYRHFGSAVSGQGFASGRRAGEGKQHISPDSLHPLGQPLSRPLTRKEGFSWPYSLCCFEVQTAAHQSQETGKGKRQDTDHDHAVSLASHFDFSPQSICCYFIP